MIDVYKRAFSDGITIGLGYLPVAVAFGITAKPILDLLATGLMSAMNYGGAGQFLTLQMLNDSSYIAIIIAIFILNSRMFVMSFKINYDLRHLNIVKRFIVSLFVTDESFALTSRYGPERKTFADYFITVFVSYLFWVVFTIVGYLTGEIMSERLVIASGIALYALFIALLMPSLGSNVRNIIVAGLGMTLHFFLIEVKIPPGIAIVISMLTAASAGLLLELRERKRGPVS